MNISEIGAWINGIFNTVVWNMTWNELTSPFHILAMDSKSDLFARQGQISNWNLYIGGHQEGFSI